MKTKYRLICGLLLVWIVVLLAACGETEKQAQPAEQTNTSGAETVPNPADQAAKPEPKPEASLSDRTYAGVELVFYSTNGDREEVFNEKYGDAIRKKFPQHTITYIQFGNGTRYPDLLAAKQPIDIILESIGQFSGGPLLHEASMNMEELIKGHQVDLSRLEQTSIEAMKLMTGGTINALPTYTNSMALYYNKELFDKFGVQPPKDGLTWDDVWELNRTLSRFVDNTHYTGIAISAPHYFRMNPFSMPYVTPNITSALANNQDYWKAMFETLALEPAKASAYRDRVEAHGLPGVNQFVKDQSVAMLAALTNVPITQDLSNVDWDVVTFPTYKQLPGVGPQLYPGYFGVSSLSQHPNEAMQVIKFLLSDEFQMSWARNGNMPAVHSPELLDVFAADTHFKDKNVRNAFFVNFAPISAKGIYDSAVESLLTRSLKDLALGNIDLNTLLRTIEEEANKILEERKQQQ